MRARRALEDDGYVVVGHYVADFGERVARCGVRGFVPKAGLSGSSLAAALSDRT